MKPDRPRRGAANSSFIDIFLSEEVVGGVQFILSHSSASYLLSRSFACQSKQADVVGGATSAAVTHADLVRVESSAAG